MPAKLYKVDASPPARAAIMACEIFSVPVEMINIDLSKGEHKSPEYLKMNPLHAVPVFVDGDLIIHDSHALMMYLADAYGNDSPLYPKDLKLRTLVNQKLFFNDGVLFKNMRTITVPAYVEGVKGITDKQLENVKESYEFLEAFLSRNKFLALDHITIADIAAFPVCCAFEYILPRDTNKYPKYNAWFKEMEKQPYVLKHNLKGATMLGKFIQSAIRVSAKQ